MDVNLQDNLEKRFPDFFGKSGLYFECGDGWYDILWHVFKQIEKTLERESKELIRPRFSGHLERLGV
jgi:hypothetical protein